MTEPSGIPIDLSAILNNPYAGKGQKVTFDPKQVYNFELEKTLDQKVLFKKLLPALENGSKQEHRAGCEQYGPGFRHHVRL